MCELWRWHLAEEFEHRGVAHDVLHALHPGWGRRVYGFSWCARHLYGFTGRVARHLLAIDRERGRSRDGDTSLRASGRRFARKERRFQLPRVARILSPGYSPHPRPTPETTRRVLASYES